MKYSTLRLSEHQPYIVSSLRLEHQEMLSLKEKTIIDQFKENPNLPKQIIQENKQRKDRRLYNQSNLSEQLPKVKQHQYKSNTIISDRNDNYICKTTASNSDDLISKYSIIQVDYKNGISSGKKISPIKLQKHLWKLSLQNLIKSQHSYKQKKMEVSILHLYPSHFVLK
ncbi:unnamed protein product [Paramecium pentaurelia]|uniref:Uncharacterized protein n=1 Tax=Paramecium pentaurelia TaxID=43138 RepID=A0A8S1WBP6_9CILI|nr:unnamed protein product [Paramecium pentaurelia]